MQECRASSIVMENEIEAVKAAHLKTLVIIIDRTWGASAEGKNMAALARQRLASAEEYERCCGVDLHDQLSLQRCLAAGILLQDDLLRQVCRGGP